METNPSRSALTPNVQRPMYSPPDATNLGQHSESTASLATVQTGTQPYMVYAGIPKTVSEDLLAVHWPNLVSQLGAVLERHTVVMKQDEDLRPHHVMNLPAGYEVRSGIHPDPGRECIELFLDPYTYSAEQLCADACRIGDEVRRSLAPAEVP